MGTSNEKQIKLSDVKHAGELQCTESEAAAFLGIRLSTFRKLLRDDERVQDNWIKGIELGRVGLRLKQMKLAGSHPQMGIFLGKQYLGQKEITTTELTGVDGEKLFDADNLSQEERDALRHLISRGSESERGSAGA